MRTIEGLLAEHEFFNGLPADVLALIAGCGTNIRFGRGEHLFREGDAADRFYVVRHGRVALEIFVPGRGPIVIDTLDDNDVVGWSWLFPPYRWAYDAEAVDDTAAIALDGVCLRGKCDENPAMGYELMKRFARIIQDRLQATRLRLLDIYADAGA